MKTAFKPGELTTQPIVLNAGDKVLLVQLRAMGDMLLTTPLIRALRQKYPQISIDVLAEYLPAQVLVNNPHLNKVHLSPPQGSGLMSYVGLIERLRHERYSLAIDLISTPGSALLTRMTNAKNRIGYDLKWRSWAYSQPVRRRVESIYNPLTKFDLVDCLRVEPVGVELEIFPSSSDDHFAIDIVKHIVNKDNPLVALAPWSKRAWRCWPISHWIDTMRGVIQMTNVTWLLFGTDQERDNLSELMGCDDLNVSWAGANSIGQVAALMKQCSAYLGADNGLKHVAVAVNLPTITVYTGSDPQVWNPPYNPNHITVDLRNVSGRVEQIDTVLHEAVHTIEMSEN